MIYDFMTTIAQTISKPLILAVEDEPSSLMILRATLEKAGFEVITAVNGQEALDRFTADHPELILLDVSMPILDGIEVCRRIRAMDEGKNIPIIMTTGMDDLTSINDSYNAGATDFIHKPIHWAILPHRVNYALRSSRNLLRMRKSEIQLANSQQLAHLGSWEMDREYKEGTLVSESFTCSEETYRLLNKAVGVSRLKAGDFFSSTSGQDARSVLRRLIRAMERNEEFEWEHEFQNNDGSSRTLLGHAQAVVWNDNRRLISGTLQDITRQRHAEAKILELAYQDGLTGLANRLALNQRLETAISQARRKKALVGVMYLDLDRFKRINDTLGHSLGDQLLQGIAQRLHTSIRSEALRDCNDDRVKMDHVDNEDNLMDAVDFGESTDMVARMGGDEFVLLLTNLKSVQPIINVSNRILESFEEPFMLDQQTVYATPSIGAAVFPYDGEDAGALLKHADTAMYHAKDAGRNNFKFYSPSMNIMASAKLTIETQLHGVIERNELRLLYQPQVRANDNMIIGMEALLRWHHPELGNISPVQFIPIAEETGLIIQIGRWVMREACQFQRMLVDSGLPQVRVAVNVSRLQFRQPDFVRMVEKILCDTGINPNFLELEITESSVMHNEEESIKLLRKLKSLGLRLALDDFGTGYSSLSYLQQFPLDLLKIDRSFIARLDTKSDHTDIPLERDAAIAIAIITMSHSLGLSVIAEGVETEHQLSLLKQHQCDEIQGYYFAPPLTGESMIEKLLTQPFMNNPGTQIFKS